MSDWNPNLYMKYANERTQPAIDLIARIHLTTPDRIIDIGCGPGNSTNALKTRWPDADLTGLDSSAAMIEQAGINYPDIKWICADAADDLRSLGKYDLVFSNAALQWLPDQDIVLRNLYGLLNSGGVLAVQVPNTVNMPLRIELKKLADSEKWKDRFRNFDTTHAVNQAGYYYDILSRLSSEIYLWQTDYYHVMDSHDDIIKWYSSTGLRPYLDILTEEEITHFLYDYKKLLEASYETSSSNGKILFPFTRIFFTAYN